MLNYQVRSMPYQPTTDLDLSSAEKTRRLPVHSVSQCQRYNHGGDRVRTDDLLRAKQVLSQLSYAPWRGGGLGVI